ncbi:MAG: cation transporter [Oscillospiraceae bacterium]
MKKVFKLHGMDCANCALKIERAIEKIDNIKSCTVNFMTTKITLDIDSETITEILDKCKSAINKIDSNITMEKA